MQKTDIQWTPWRSIKTNTSEDHTARNEERVQVAVQCDSSSGQLLVTEHAPPGVSQLVMFRSDVAKIQHLVWNEETKAKYKMAEDSSQREFKKHLASLKGHRGTEAEIQQHARETFTREPAVEYHSMFGEGVPPIRWLVVSDEVIPPPAVKAEAATQQSEALAKAIAAIAEQMAKANQQRR